MNTIKTDELLDDRDDIRRYLNGLVQAGREEGQTYSYWLGELAIINEQITKVGH
mgnify:CR=1 FL=1|tara:strand:- start:3368 stop:3529 length:162 start_codon:yes stop_codon:yes gene_type:complete